LIQDLIDVVSKNGALLLNIGPRADGTIPEPEQAILRTIGRWLAINGEAIYSTRPWKIYGEGPTEVAAGAFTDTQRAPFTSADIRFTCKANTLYALFLARPDTHATVRSLGTASTLLEGAITAVELLGSTAPLTWSVAQDGLDIQLPTGSHDESPCVFKIQFAPAYP
jgi:alpha-L-fucosidase